MSFSSLFRIGGLGAGMTAERSGGNEFAQLMTNHVFCHIDGNMLAAVMDSDRMTDKGGEDRGAAAPGLENLLLAGLVQFFDSLDKLRGNKRAFFDASAHFLHCLLLTYR